MTDGRKGFRQTDNAKTISPPPNSVSGGYLELFKLRAGLITITESCEKIVRYIYLQIVTLSTGSVNK